MSTSRCPECGAAHKDDSDMCRLCGAPLHTAVTVRSYAVSAEDATRVNESNLTHFAWIGLGVVAIIAVGAIAFGAVESPTLERWVNKLPFVDDNVDDGWFAWSDPDEVMIIEVPAVPEAADDDSQVDLGGDTLLWTTTLSDNRFLFGHTDGLDADSESEDLGDATEVLNDAVDSLAEQQEGVVLSDGETFRVGSGYGVDALIDGLSLEAGPAYGLVRMVLSDGELIVIQTIDYETSSDYHDRMADSLIVVADNPDVTIPTIPANVEASEG